MNRKLNDFITPGKYILLRDFELRQIIKIVDFRKGQFIADRAFERRQLTRQIEEDCIYQLSVTNNDIEKWRKVARHIEEARIKRGVNYDEI